MIQLLFLVVLIALAILFLNTLATTLKAVDYNNRKIQPDQVWLTLIPVFNFIWLFILTKRLSDSVRAQFLRKGAPVPAHPAYFAGLAYSILVLVNTALNAAALGNRGLHAITPFTGLLSLAAWITYWVTVAGYKKKLRQLPPDDFSESPVFGNNILP